MTSLVGSTLHDPLCDRGANSREMRRQRVGRRMVHVDPGQVLFGEGEGGEGENDKEKIRDFQGVFFLFFVVCCECLTIALGMP